MQVVLTMVGEKDPLLKDNIERYLVQLEKSKNNTNQTNMEGTTGNKTDLSENSRQSVGQHMAAEKLSGRPAYGSSGRPAGSGCCKSIKRK